jgi:hypothetical protein
VWTAPFDLGGRVLDVDITGRFIDAGDVAFDSLLRWLCPA